MEYSLETKIGDAGVFFSLRLPTGVFEGEVRGVAGEEEREDREKGGGAAMLGLGDLFRQLAGSEDRFVRAAVDRAEAEGARVSCLKGCAACCRQLVTVSPPEAFAILDWIDALAAEEREAALGRFAEAEARLEAAGMVDVLSSLDDPAMDGQDHYHVAARYFQLGLDCPLLKNELCEAYPIRPASCREYFVTSGVEACRNPVVEIVRPVPVELSLRDVLASVSADLLRTEIELVPLPLLARWGRDRDDDRRRRWKAARLGSAFAAHLEYVLSSNG